VSTFLLIAKAGGSGEAPENTCEAIARAVALRSSVGIEIGIEVDLRLSSDGQLVAIHDARLERTTTGRGLVRQHGVRDLCRLQAGANGERVPTLLDVLEAVGDRPLLLDLHDDDAAVAVALCRELARARRQQRDAIWVASEHGRVVAAVRRLDPSLRTAATKRQAWAKLLLGRAGLGRLAPRGHVWIVPERHAGFQVITPPFVDTARAVGDAVWAFVIDEVAAMERLRSWGVGGCICSRPAHLAASLARS
jgi:glycerophosphoryl diester phosphodiesterase